MAEPAAKKVKVDEEAKEEVKEEKFQEPDAPKDNRPAIKEKIAFETAETTLNVIPALGGKMLNCLTEGGMAYLYAGARANVAQKSGRYMFETKVVQNMGKFHVRMGFSTSEAGLILGEDNQSVFFDSEGSFIAAKKRQNVKNGRFGQGVVAVVLNLDAKSPNKNTLALYRDGVAVDEPKALPEELQGKPLFPHVSFRNASMRINFGSEPLKALPFACRMLQSAAASDVSVAASKQPKDGKFNVMMPVAFPDEGTFDWLDTFLEKNPGYVELSDRKIEQWAKASGHPSKGGGWGAKQASNDKPQPNFGIKELDDMSVRKIISAVAPVMPRNYVVMEVKSNLVASERQEVLKKFNYPCYKKTARVVMGEPPAAFKAIVQEKILKEKQAKADAAFKAKKAEIERKKIAAQRQKEAAARKKEAEKKKAAEKRKKEIEEKKAKGEEVDETEEKEEEKEEEPEEPKGEEEELTEPPAVELTDEEKATSFTPKSTPDLAPQVMSANYTKFSTPDADEGFDDITYEWSKADKAAAYLKKWQMEKKLTTRVDDIKPGQAFREKKAAFEKLLTEWKAKLTTFKTGGAKKGKKNDEDAGDDVDIFSVTDVSDVGSGVPLFEHFTFEDWLLVELRFKMCWLVLSFKADVKDDDREGIPKDHFAFYYQKYYSSPVGHKTYGVTTNEELFAFIKDTVSVKEGLVVSQLSDDLDNLDIFLKLTEEQRRERQRRIDAGDETARLNNFVETKAAAARPEPKAVAKPEAKPAAAKPAAAKPAAAKPAAVKPAAKEAAKPLTSIAGTPAPKAKVSATNKPAWGKGKGKW